MPVVTSHASVSSALTVTSNTTSYVPFMSGEGSRDKKQQVIYFFHSKLQLPSKVALA
jgi:hypothetical protein